MSAVPILTPNSSSSFNAFLFSPCTLTGMKSPYSGFSGMKEIENLFETKGQEFENTQLNRGLECSPLINFLEFPSPLSIQNQIQNKISFSNEIPKLELPLNIQKKLDEPSKKKEN
jgi:hypothetical protein